MKRPLLWAALFLTLGVLILNARAETRDRWLLRKPSVRTALERSSSGVFPLNLTGKVLWAEEKNGRTVLRVNAGKKYGTVLVYTDEEKPLSREEVLSAVGSACIVSGTAFLFQNAENPGQFDVRSYYDSLGVYFGISKAEIVVRAVPKVSLSRLFYRISTSFRRAVSENAAPQEAAFLLSMSLGDDSELTEDIMREASLLSVIQLLSLSGFVISSLGMLLYGLLRRLCRNLSVCAAVPVLCMVFYYMLLGSPVSFIRALLVFLIRVLAPVLKRRFDTLSAASLSALLLGLARPLWLLLPSMQFYLAVLVSHGLILPAYRKASLRRPVLAELLLSFFSMQACLLPIQILTRFRFSPYGGILVFFLLPLRTAALVLTLIGGLLGAACGSAVNGAVQVFLFLPKQLRLLYEAILSAFRFLPASSVNAGTPPFYRILIYFILLSSAPAALLIRSSIMRKRRSTKELRPSGCVLFGVPAAFAFLACFGMLFLHAPIPGREEMIYTMLSVGQGDSGVVRTRDLTIGVDAGSSSNDSAGRIFTDALSCYGVRQLDILLLTHGDLDHVNGLSDILEDPSCIPREVWIPDVKHADLEFQEQLALLSQKGVTVRRIGAGDRLVSGNTVLEVLYPRHGEDLEGNDASPVLLVSHLGCSVLFTGDISMEAEEKVRLDGKCADILKVAHHGSRFSSGETFIRSVSPALALVSYGRNNRYGHPSEETVERFRMEGIPFYGTGEYGAIEVCLISKRTNLHFYGAGK